jgi:mannose-6-phosphate isomerase-like protein (cupin superfamily)
MLKNQLFLCLIFCISVKAKELKGPLQTGWKGKNVCEQLSENTHQRILRCTFPPGVGHEKHKHNANFGYAIAGGKMQITDEKGTKIVNLATDSYFESEGKKWHEVLNLGQSTVVYLIVESKSKDGGA